MTFMWKRADKMKKRTNNKETLSEHILLIILPLILLILVFSNGLEKSFEKILYTGAYLSTPETMLLKNKEKTSDSINEMVGSDTIETESVKKISSIPDDILQLMAKAEIQYKNSSQDGKIVEKDYSALNATSEYNGIYIKNTTSKKLNIPEQLKKSVNPIVDKNKPSVLIFHTHTSETYELLDRGFYSNARGPRSENSKENMIRVGEEICKVLNSRGIKTIHDKTVYDGFYNGAYERSREGITKILKENPSIKVVLDVHRDAIYLKDGTRIKPVIEIYGKKAAQIMILTGCEDGNVKNFPQWEKNLAFAVQLQNKISKDNPKLLRPLMFCNRKYNMHLTPCSLLVEFGTDANTLAEAVYSAELFAESLADYLEESC